MISFMVFHVFLILEHMEGYTLGDDVRGRPGAVCYDS